jgi:DNA adenine methylase
MRGEGPLRYPGAKSNLARFVVEFMERRHLVGLPVAEPFAGSAAVSCYLVSRRIAPSASLWEADIGAYSFWVSVLEHCESLRLRVAEAPITLEEFDRCTDYLRGLVAPPDDPVEAGYAFLFLNRTSYSGIVGAGPIGGRTQSSAYPIDCRFNRSRLDAQLANLGKLSGLVTITFGDGIAAISQCEDSFIYADPPYFTNGKKFYNKHFGTFDHFRLRKALAASHGRWLLSYDYDRKVEYLYRAFPSRTIQLFHSAREAKSKREFIASPLGFSEMTAAELAAETGLAGAASI